MAGDPPGRAGGVRVQPPEVEDHVDVLRDGAERLGRAKQVISQRLACAPQPGPKEVTKTEPATVLGGRFRNEVQMPRAVGRPRDRHECEIEARQLLVQDRKRLTSALGGRDATAGGYALQADVERTVSDGDPERLGAPPQRSARRRVPVACDADERRRQGPRRFVALTERAALPRAIEKERDVGRASDGAAVEREVECVRWHQLTEPTITPGVVHASYDVEDPIRINWTDRKLGKAQGSDRAGRRLLGPERWIALKRRIRSLEVADSLLDLRGVPGGFHPLGADRAGEWAASLSPNWRLVFEPADDPPPTLPDGGVDLARVTHVRVLRVEDYHGR